jgi:hypothetical protein
MTLIEIADVKLGSASKRAAAQRTDPKPATKQAPKPAKDEATESEAAAE